MNCIFSVSLTILLVPILSGSAIKVEKVIFPFSRPSVRNESIASMQVSNDSFHISSNIRSSCATMADLISRSNMIFVGNINLWLRNHSSERAANSLILFVFGINSLINHSLYFVRSESFDFLMPR